MVYSHGKPMSPVPRPLKLWVLAALVFVLLVCVVFTLYVTNAFGRKLSGTAECVNGPLVSVSVEAQSYPFVQSGDPAWRLKPTSDRQAVFTHELPLGGRYKVIVKCGKLPDGTAESENHTDWLDADTPDIQCFNRSSVNGLPVAGECALRQQ